MYIERISVDGIRGFHDGRAVEDLEFPLPGGALGSWTVLAGRNGSGKTTLLRAVALGLIGHFYGREVVSEPHRFDYWLSKNRESGTVTTTISHHEGWDGFTGKGNTPGGSFEGQLHWKRSEHARGAGVVGPHDVSLSKSAARGPWSEESTGWFVAGYGPFRRLEGGSDKAQRLTYGNTPVSRVASLFNEDVSLAESIEWIKGLHFRSLEKKPGSQRLLGFVKRILNEGLLPDGFQVTDVDSDGLWAERDGVPVLMHELSDGYRTVAALVLDLVRQVSVVTEGRGLAFDEQGSPYISMPGVVLIDEVDVHLHVSWQKEIGGWLKRHFPSIQFIVSSHSPYICQSADPGGLVRLPGVNEEEGPRVVPDELYQRIVNGSGDDALLTDLFGIDSPYSQTAEEKRRRLSALELALLQGTASEDDREEHARLSRSLGSSLAARVDEVASRLRPGA
ncbi:AAA family ATPase [Nocardiopsis aegyptia]|uniref:Energy-coupling factor transporter ATP-binding protein EcfA2 n=1 Tax=Nocardiopsis aegyptia TaxID=220378 RepID=A0A7Z0EQ03_9ACTN|nr:AAA family ATPase [Nocardiopsis aegyptia]NYJ36164.1 energy-coupling factor transporter ATP-binding protein EcfA2 [Nocardiopsis aegyptia]